MRTRLLFLLAASVIWLSGCKALNSASVKEVALIATEDGDRVLREPMQPIRGETRVLIFALDGVGRDSFMRALRENRMPQTAALLGAESPDGNAFEHGYSPEDVLSVIPSSTPAAWTSAFTGRPPAETGVPGNEWFDRSERRFHAPSPVTTRRRFQVVGTYNEDLMGEKIQVPTLYEQTPLRSHVSLLDIYRGADMITIPEVEPFGTLFNAGLREFFGADSARHRLYEKLDEVSIASLAESLQRYGVADLQTIYFPGIDLFTHIAHEPEESQQRYLEKVTDPAIGRVLDLYRKRGVLENTYVIFVSDHGQTPVAIEGAGALWGGGSDHPPELLRRLGFRVRPWGLTIRRRQEDFQAVLAYQGGLANVYLADRSTCEARGMACDWPVTPRFEEDLMPVVRAFDEANRHGAHVPALQGKLDLILGRTGAVPGRDAPAFEVYDDGRMVPLAEYLTQHPRPDLLAFERRLNDLSVGPYGHLAGDVLLIPRMRLDEPIEDRSYFGEAFHTWHGSPNRDDSEIVFVLAHPRENGDSLREFVQAASGDRASIMDLTPLVLSLLNLSDAPPGASD